MIKLTSHATAGFRPSISSSSDSGASASPIIAIDAGLLGSSFDTSNAAAGSSNSASASASANANASSSSSSNNKHKKPKSGKNKGDKKSNDHKGDASVSANRNNAEAAVTGANSSDHHGDYAQNSY